MPELNSEFVQQFISEVKGGVEYQRPECKEVVDKGAEQLTTLVNAGTLNHVPGVRVIQQIFLEIGEAIEKAQIEIGKETAGPLTAEERDELIQKLIVPYNEMEATLKDFGFPQAQPQWAIMILNAIDNLPPDTQREILKFGRPTVIITPPGDFASKIKAIDNHKIIPEQADTACTPEPNDALWGGGSSKMVVTVVDGLDAMPQPSFITDNLNVGQKMEKYEEDFANRKLDVMSAPEWTMLMMQSLRRGQPVDDVNSTRTVTYFSRKHLIKGSVVPYGCWNSANPQVYFRRNIPDATNDTLRCRPSVRVMEIEPQNSLVDKFLEDISYLSFTPAQLEKLRKMFEGYDESILAAKEVDPNVEIKPLHEVMAAFLKLGPEKLKEIANFGQPTLIVTPKNSFEDKLANMNQHKYFVPFDNETQADASCRSDAGSPFETVGTPQQTTVSVVDGQPRVPHIPGIAPDSRYDARKSAFKNHFAKKNMRLMNVHEAAVLEQLSLHAHQKNGNHWDKIVDFSMGGGEDTESCLDDEYLTDSPHIAYSCFNYNNGVSFDVAGIDATIANLRGRPSVPFLTY